MIIRNHDNIMQYSSVGSINYKYINIPQVFHFLNLVRFEINCLTLTYDISVKVYID